MQLDTYTQPKREKSIDLYQARELIQLKNRPGLAIFSPKVPVKKLVCSKKFWHVRFLQDNGI